MAYKLFRKGMGKPKPDSPECFTIGQMAVAVSPEMVKASKMGPALRRLADILLERRKEVGDSPTVGIGFIDLTFNYRLGDFGKGKRQ
jgi:hypothetical protein